MYAGYVELPSLEAYPCEYQVTAEHMAYGLSGNIWLAIVGNKVLG